MGLWMRILCWQLWGALSTVWRWRPWLWDRLRPDWDLQVRPAFSDRPVSRACNLPACPIAACLVHIIGCGSEIRPQSKLKTLVCDSLHQTLFEVATLTFTWSPVAQASNLCLISMEMYVWQVDTLRGWSITYASYLSKMGTHHIASACMKLVSMAATPLADDVGEALLMERWFG